MENTQDARKSSEIAQSFGVDRWQRKKSSRYEVEDFIVSPPSQEEGGFFQLRYGKSIASKPSTYKKITQELSQDTQGTLAGSVMSYLGGEKQRSNIGDIGGAISINASGGFSFDDFSKHPDLPSDIPYPDLTLEAQLFPQADPLITLPWGKYNLPKDTTRTSDNPSMTYAPDYDSEEQKIAQAVKNLNITAKEVTYADITTQACENITLNSPKILHDNHLPDKVESCKRERKKSSLQEYLASLANSTIKSHHRGEEAEHDEEDEKEEKRRISRESERHSEIFSQNMELTQEKTSLNNQYNNHNNFNDRAAEVQNNDLLYEPYKPLALIEPEVINDIENKEKQITSTNEKNTESPEVKYELKAQETVKPTKVETKERKTSFLALVSPFIPFKESSIVTENPITPTEEVNGQISPKTVSRFFYTEGYEERKKSSSVEPDDISHNSKQLTNDFTSSKPKVKKRRPKPSALREMNVWGPSSM